MAAVCCALLYFSAGSLARANGRFPETNHVYVSPTDPNEIIVRVSFGLLISRDRGATFDWVCEQVLGVTGIEDPMYGYLKGGGLVASSFQGIIASRDRACSWPLVASAGPLVFIDLTQRAAQRDRVLALESSYDTQDDAGALLFKNQVWESTDDAVTFRPLGPRLDPSLLGYTIDIAPSDPSRVYLSATRNPGTAPTGVLLVSRNAGTTWEELPFPLEGTERAPFIAAVDPSNPDRLYVRTTNGTDKPGRLLLSDDAGKTFRTIFQGESDLKGFSLTPDGSKVYVGGSKGGLHVASTTDFAFRKISDVEVQCVTATADDLWVCSNESSGFIVAHSKDEAASYERVTHFTDIRGPLDCPPVPPFDACIQSWPALKRNLGFPEPDAGADAGPAATSDAGPSAAPIGASGGCACQASTGTSVAGALVGIALAGALVLRRRR